MNVKVGTVFLFIYCALGLASEKQIDCSDAKSTPESIACANIKHDTTDKKLNTVFKKMKSEMNKTQVKYLVAAQKGWIQLRDNQCNLECFGDRGTGMNERYLECLTTFTEQRIKQLELTPTDSTAGD